MTKNTGYTALTLISALIGCGRPVPDVIEFPDAAQATPDNTTSSMTAEEGMVAATAQAELNAQLERDRRIEEVRQRDPAVNWVNIGITTGKFSESIGSSVHQTYQDCIARSAMEDNECFPIAALPDSYWKARLQ